MWTSLCPNVTELTVRRVQSENFRAYHDEIQKGRLTNINKVTIWGRDGELVDFNE